jgi:Asp-tRNA(Asn)/Glu-tRNA(Gln) amidotransferase A subunit family amidase
LTVPSRVQATASRSDANDELHYLSATEALERFAHRSLSPVELVDAVISRAEATEPAVNALTARYWERAREGARESEARFMGKGEAPRPLEGIPTAIKELTPVSGQQHTLGSLALADVVAERTAPVAERIIDAGGVVHARTATPEFGCASFTHSRLFGLTRNPWNFDFSPAGSSGGAAAALAAGSTTLAQGTDSAGSLRLPAAACGVVGFKPPHGRVPGLPPVGLEPCNHDGPLARTVEDCALLQNVIAGPHAADPNALRPTLRIPLPLRRVDGWRIALAIDLAGVEIDSDVAASTAAAAEALRSAGATVDEVELGWEFERIMDATKLHFAATYGPLVKRVVETNPDLVTRYAIAFVEEEDRYAEPADFVLRANEIKAELWKPLSRVLTKYRALLSPTLAFPAPEAGQDYIDEGPIVNGAEHPDRWIVATTVPFNLLSHCPAISVPSGIASNGIPTGAQIVGRPYDDVSVFRIAGALQESRPWLESRPSL